MIDASVCLAAAVYRLGFGAQSEISAANSWVTETELYQWGDEAVKRLSREISLFINYSTSTMTQAYLATYTLSPRHVYTLLAAVVTTSESQILRPTTVRELYALDAAWPSTPGFPRRASLDAGPVGTITLYPLPTAAGYTVAQLEQEIPDDVSAAAPQVAVPAVLEPYVTYAMLAGARGKESEAAMPEMSDHFRQRLSLYEQVMRHLWGGGQ